MSDRYIEIKLVDEDKFLTKHEAEVRIEMAELEYMEKFDPNHLRTVVAALQWKIDQQKDL